MIGPRKRHLLPQGRTKRQGHPFLWTAKASKKYESTPYRKATYKPRSTRRAHINIYAKKVITGRAAAAHEDRMLGETWTCTFCGLKARGITFVNHHGCPRCGR